jgi:hypothetical protein
MAVQPIRQNRRAWQKAPVAGHHPATGSVVEVGRGLAKPALADDLLESERAMRCRAVPHELRAPTTRFGCCAWD